MAARRSSQPRQSALVPCVQVWGSPAVLCSLGPRALSQPCLIFQSGCCTHPPRLTHQGQVELCSGRDMLLSLRSASLRFHSEQMICAHRMTDESFCSLSSIHHVKLSIHLSKLRQRQGQLAVGIICSWLFAMPVCASFMQVTSSFWCCLCQRTAV